MHLLFLNFYCVLKYKKHFKVTILHFKVFFNIIGHVLHIFIYFMQYMLNMILLLFSFFSFVFYCFYWCFFNCIYNFLCFNCISFNSWSFFWSSCFSATGSSTKSSFTVISLFSILAPTNSLVLAAFPTLSLK